MRRFLLDRIKEWCERPNRKPLLLQGSRQVGKSWLLREAGKTLFDDYVVINFDRESDIQTLFNTTKDVTRLIEQIGLIKGRIIQPQKTLLIFDEIQECAAALNSLKYFREDAPEYAVAAAGSLLGVALNHSNISFPVGQVDFMTLYPLTFYEFLEAEDTSLFKALLSYKYTDTLPDNIFNRLEEKYKVYLLIGGMPEVVSIWLSSRDMREVEKTLDSIVKSYEFDFSKYASPADVMKIKQVWGNLQEQLAKENKKFRYALIRHGARSRDYESAINWLATAGLVHKVANTETSRLPLNAYKNEEAFKLYLSDVGILRRMFGLSADTLLLNNRIFTEFKGIIAENHVLNSMIAQTNSFPLYWTSGNQAEVEFVFQNNDMIIPVEVKAATNVQAKSLKYYRQTYQPKLSVRCSLRNLQYAEGLLNLPLFMADRMFDFISDCDRDLCD